MSDCSDYPTLSDAKGFKTNANTINEVVTSSDDRTSPAIDGNTKLTLKGFENQVDILIADGTQEITDAIENTIGKSYIGAWTQGITTFSTMNEYSDFNGITYKPKSGITLPYTAQTADPTTSPDNANVEPFSDINSNNISDYTDLNFETLVAATASTLIKEGAAVSINERELGSGGGATWDAVQLSSVTPNGIDIVQCSGVTSIALVLRQPEGQFVEALGANETDDNASILARASEFGVLNLSPFRQYPTTPFQFTGDLVIHGNKGGFVPLSSGKLISNSGSGSLTIMDIESDLGENYTTSSDGLVEVDGLESFHLYRTKIINGGRHVFCKNTSHVIWKDNRSEDSADWGLFLEGDCSVFEITGNHASGCETHDGIKVGGLSSGTAVFIKNGIISNNVCRNNFRDGIDMAVNGCENLVISNNIFADNTLKGLDLKILSPGALGQTDFKNVTISDNTIVMNATGATDGISIQNEDLSNVSFKDVCISGGVITGDISVQCSGVKLQNCSDVDVNGININSVFQGVRLIDAAQSNNIHGNTIHASIPFQIETINSGTPDNNKFYKNVISQQNVLSDSNTARVFHGDNNQFWDNQIDKPLTAQYSLNAENLGTAATNTKWYNNNLGFVTDAPTGVRVVVGDVFIDVSYALGYPAKWVGNTQTSNSSLDTLYGVGQRGYRENAGDPNGSVSSQFLGEVLYDSTGNKFWKSKGAGLTNWVSLQ